MEFADRLVWITGASSGIGEALAYTLSRRGARLVLSARREEVLHEVRGRCTRPEQHAVCPLDLADPDSLDAAAERVERELGGADVLVNNGGISQRGRAAETEMEVVRHIMEVNFFGAVHLTRAVLPGMLERGGGHVAAVSSLVGKFGTAKRSSYAASKHALHGWFDSLRAEVYDDGVGVTLVCPGFVKTSVVQNALRADGSPIGDTDKEKGMPPEDCADAIARAIEQNKDEIYVGGWELLGVYAKRFVPSLFNAAIRRLDV
jgi:short-subunit dehydrogenase